MLVLSYPSPNWVNMNICTSCASLENKNKTYIVEVNRPSYCSILCSQAQPFKILLCMPNLKIKYISLMRKLYNVYIGQGLNNYTLTYTSIFNVYLKIQIKNLQYRIQGFGLSGTVLFQTEDLGSSLRTTKNNTHTEKEYQDYIFLLNNHYMQIIISFLSPVTKMLLTVGHTKRNQARNRYIPSVTFNEQYAACYSNATSQKATEIW